MVYDWTEEPIPVLLKRIQEQGLKNNSWWARLRGFLLNLLSRERRKRMK